MGDAFHGHQELWRPDKDAAMMVDGIQGGSCLNLLLFKVMGSTLYAQKGVMNIKGLEASGK